jgi:hypothetical protein
MRSGERNRQKQWPSLSTSAPRQRAPKSRARELWTLRGVFSRNRLAHVGGQLAIVQSQPRIQLSFCLVRRELSDQFAFGCEGLKLFQFVFKVGHGNDPLTPPAPPSYALELRHGEHRYPVELFFCLARPQLCSRQSALEPLRMADMAVYLSASARRSRSRCIPVAAVSGAAQGARFAVNRGSSPAATRRHPQ